ncbi:hypothetical protein D9619_002351 [Psilocybe cf. subviscida]|uniref:Uncharacterized protein n=1 Tax=Psilocybe cf. subviscida TaxID=2480587 RepID=A0A8H5AVQ3_9AGAR|nr:hypothetical protein D9619_002351 [Psilocybe cf. subviscida]
MMRVDTAEINQIAPSDPDYLGSPSFTLATGVRMLIEEVRKLREEKCALHRSPPPCPPPPSEMVDDVLLPTPFLKIAKPGWRTIVPGHERRKPGQEPHQKQELLISSFEIPLVANVGSQAGCSPWPWGDWKQDSIGAGMAPPSNSQPASLFKARKLNQ